MGNRQRLRTPAPVFIWITEEIQLMGFVYPLRYYLFPTSAFQFQWGSFSFFVILTFVMTEFFSVAPLRRLLKKSPIEQMKNITGKKSTGKEGFYEFFHPSGTYQ